MISVMERPVRAPAQPLQSPRQPNRLAEQITGRPYLSHSQVSLMRTCPRKFAFQYVENAPKDFLPSSLMLGVYIHRNLELYIRARKKGLDVTPEDILVLKNAGSLTPAGMRTSTERASPLSVICSRRMAP